MVRTIGWHPGGLVDLSRAGAPVGARRRQRDRDGRRLRRAHRHDRASSYIGYSPDYPGWLRESLRALDGRRGRVPAGRRRQRDAAARVRRRPARSRSRHRPPARARGGARDRRPARAGRERLVETGFALRDAARALPDGAVDGRAARARGGRGDGRLPAPAAAVGRRDRGRARARRARARRGRGARRATRASCASCASTASTGRGGRSPSSRREPAHERRPARSRRSGSATPPS